MKTTRLLVSLLAAASAAFLAACESDYDDSDHNPPAGMGAIVIENNTYNDIEVFLDGVRVKNVSDDDDRAYDLAPGEYRVFLNEDDGRREWSHRVDVLENRNTVLYVSNDAFDFDDYSVIIDHQDP